MIHADAPHCITGKSLILLLAALALAMTFASVALLLLSRDACAKEPGQVIVELQQNNGIDITQCKEFQAQKIGGTDTTTRQEYKFQRQRAGKHFTYIVANLEPLATYDVELSFVEHDFSAAGSRKFNVYIKSDRVITTLDIYAEAGANQACQRVFKAGSDSGGRIAVRFRSDERDCVGYATISTIRIFKEGVDAVEINASACRNNMDPPIRHYNSSTQNTFEAILGRLGSRISFNLVPQRLATRFTTLGTWTGDLSEMVLGLKCRNNIRCLPFTDRFQTWESIEQSQTMTGQSFRCSSPAMPFQVTVSFRSPFYPENEKISLAPFFYIDISVRNVGKRKASGVFLVGRPHKEEFRDCHISEFTGANTVGFTYKTAYSDKDETYTLYNRKRAVEALALPAAESQGVDFRGSEVDEFSDYSGGSLWGWPSPEGYPEGRNDPKSPVYSFYPRGYSGASWSVKDLAPGESETKHFVLAGYTPDRILTVENPLYEDSSFRFKYRKYFDNVMDVVDYAVTSRQGGDMIDEKADFFDSTIFSDSYLQLDPAYKTEVRNLMACSFQSFLTNTWWAHSDRGRDWFSVWEGTWMRFHGTVDVEYNQAWFYFDFWPELMRKVIDQWTLYLKSNELGTYVPHDMGISDYVTGQAYDHDMPVEENTNFILLLYRYWKSTGDSSYAKKRLDLVRKLVDFITRCDTNNNGLPDVGAETTFDDGTPALERGRDQSYLGVKCLAAYRAAEEMALAVSPSDSRFAETCQGRIELINQAMEYDLWLSDHYAVCLDGEVEAADREAYSIHTTNGLLYLLSSVRNTGVTSGNIERMRADLENSTARTLKRYGSSHTSYDSGRMWVSSNLWRDQAACRLGVSLAGENPLALSRRYWELEQYFGGFLNGGYWDGLIYGREAGLSGKHPGGYEKTDSKRFVEAGVPPPVGIVAERPTYFNYRGAWSGGHTVIGATSPSAAFYFAEGSCRPDFDPYICIQNPGGSEADVRITYMLGDGNTPEQAIKVGARSRSTVRVKDTLGEGDDSSHDFSARVEAVNGTAGSQLMSYYPRGMASLGLIDAAAGLVIDNEAEALYYAPTAAPLRVPVFSRADWDNQDPSMRLPVLYFETQQGRPAVRNRHLLPRTVDADRVLSVENLSAGRHAISPNGDGVNDSASITYELPVTSGVSNSIWEGANRERSFEHGIRNHGKASYTWDGKNAYGEVAEDGLHTARVDARANDAGFQVQPASAPVWVNNCIPDLSQDWYLAEGYTGSNASSGDFEEYVLMQNPNPEAANVSVTFMLPDGRKVERAWRVTANSRFTVAVDDILPNSEVSTHVRADRKIAVERAMYFNGRRAGHACIGVNRPSKKWYFAEGYTAENFDEFILVQNPGNETATITMTFMTPEEGKTTEKYKVGAHSRFTIHVDELLPSHEVSTVIESDHPVVAERTQYLNNMKAGTCSIGARSTSRTWYLAEGYTDRGFEEWILIENPQKTENAITVFFMEKYGANTVKNYTLPPESRFTIPVDEILPASEVSVKVRAESPLLVERSMYWNNRSDGHTFIGTPTPDTEWYLAEGYTAGGFETWILLQNPGDVTANVSCVFMGPSGRNTTREYAVGPRSRFTIKANDIIPAAEFSTRVASDAFIIVERAMYFNNRTGGTDSLGIRGY